MAKYSCFRSTLDDTEWMDGRLDSNTSSEEVKPVTYVVHREKKSYGKRAHVSKRYEQGTSAGILL